MKFARLMLLVGFPFIELAGRIILRANNKIKTDRC